MIDAIHAVHNAPVDREHVIQTVVDDLSVPGTVLALGLRRAGPQDGHAERHSRGSASEGKDGLTRYFVESLNILAIDPLQNLRIFAADGWAYGNVGVDVVITRVVELILASDVLLGVDSFDLVFVPRTGSAR